MIRMRSTLKGLVGMVIKHLSSILLAKIMVAFYQHKILIEFTAN